MYPGRKDVSRTKKKEKKQRRKKVCERKKMRATDDLKESASCQGFAANPDRVQSPARNKYNRNPRLTSRIDNDLLPIERDPPIDRRRYSSIGRTPRGRTRSPTSGRGHGRGREIPLGRVPRRSLTVEGMYTRYRGMDFSSLESLTYLGSGITGGPPRGSPDERAKRDRRN